MLDTGTFGSVQFFRRKQGSVTPDQHAIDNNSMFRKFLNNWTQLLWCTDDANAVYRFPERAWIVIENCDDLYISAPSKRASCAHKAMRVAYIRSR